MLRLLLTGLLLPVLLTLSVSEHGECQCGEDEQSGEQGAFHGANLG